VEKRVFSENEVVFREGDLGRSFYRIESGIAGVYLCYGEKDQRKLTEMKPGQYFGEMAIIEARPRSTTIVAEKELHVLEIQENELNKFFHGGTGNDPGPHETVERKNPYTDRGI